MKIDKLHFNRSSQLLFAVWQPHATQWLLTLCHTISLPPLRLDVTNLEGAQGQVATAAVSHELVNTVHQA